MRQRLLNWLEQKIIEDAATAMLAQANQKTKRILDLFE